LRHAAERRVVSPGETRYFFDDVDDVGVDDVFDFGTCCLVSVLGGGAAGAPQLVPRSAMISMFVDSATRVERAATTGRITLQTALSAASCPSTAIALRLSRQPRCRYARRHHGPS